MGRRRNRHVRPRLIPPAALEAIQAGAKRGRKQRAKNARALQAAFPPGLRAALNARHIDGDINELLSVLRGWDRTTDPTAPTGYRYPSWDLPADVRAADARLIADLRNVAIFEPGDPMAPEPLHLIPLHVAVLLLRRMVEGDWKIYSSGIRALSVAALDVKRLRGRATTPLEKVLTAVNCDAAVNVLRAYDQLPREVRRLLGRCQNPRCPHGRPWHVGLEAPARFCPPSCRTRAAEAGVHVSQGKKYSRPATTLLASRKSR